MKPENTDNKKGVHNMFQTQLNRFYWQTMLYTQLSYTSFADYADASAATRQDNPSLYLFCHLTHETEVQKRKHFKFQALNDRIG